MPRHDGYTRRESYGQRRRRRLLLERMKANADAIDARKARKAERKAAQLARAQAEDAADRRRYARDGAPPVGAPDTSTSTAVPVRRSWPCADCATTISSGRRCRECHQRFLRTSGRPW